MVVSNNFQSRKELHFSRIVEKGINWFHWEEYILHGFILLESLWGRMECHEGPKFAVVTVVAEYMAGGGYKEVRRWVEEINNMERG